ncbi:hypothetical protein O181_121051 [Austropuccinia psidii MF-1]|uniref:DUF4939 domain-containing protein n=1 Tax=Austropuccinia psidii MF-1 TaxID=1389203 RepID=A0A9Q3KJM2_9BASI|nr:hypothetical protein [Austropuccinia psidii MF-1]
MSECARARLGEVDNEEGEESVEEEDYGETEVADALANAPEMMQQMTQLKGQLTQAVTSRDNSKAPAAPNSFDGTQAHKLRGFIQSCQLIFHNDPANFFSDRKKVLYSTSFLTGRAGKWIEPYLSNISNEDPSYLLNNWQLLKLNYSLCLVTPMKSERLNRSWTI